MASDKVVKLIEEVKSLTVLELSELVKALETEFGVSAAAPVYQLPLTSSGTQTPALVPASRWLPSQQPQSSRNGWK